MCATPTTHLQIAYGSLNDSVVSLFLVFSWRDQLCSLQRWGPAARVQPQGCDGAQGFLAGSQAFAHGVQQVLCLHYLMQLPMSYTNPRLLSSVK